MIQPTPPTPTSGQVGEQTASRLTAGGVDAGSARSPDSRSWSGTNMSGWLQLFPALELDATLCAAVDLWRRSTRRGCLILWNAPESGLRFAWAGGSPKQPHPDWILRLGTDGESEEVVAGELALNPGIPAWLDWLGLDCGERELVVSPLALEDVPAVGQICFTPSGRSVPAIDPVGLEVTTRALWQATLFESQLQQRKLAALAELAAGAGHEVNNPLGTILGRSQQLLRDEVHPERRRRLATIGAQALRVRDMISDLMLFGRPPAPRLQSVDVAAVIRDMQARFVADERISAGVNVDLDLHESLIIDADATQTEIVVSELFRNSLDALAGRLQREGEAPAEPDLQLTADSLCGSAGASPSRTQGKICIAAEHVASAADPRQHVIRLTWSDNGPGLTPLEREHLFDPFFSGRQAGRGLGFGLSKCWQILRAHGGTIRVAHPGGEGDKSGLILVIEWPTSLVANDAHDRKSIEGKGSRRGAEIAERNL